MRIQDGKGACRSLQAPDLAQNRTIHGIGEGAGLRLDYGQLAPSAKKQKQKNG